MPGSSMTPTDDYEFLRKARRELDKNGADWCDFWFTLGHAASYQPGDYLRAYEHMLTCREKRETRT